MVWYSRAAWHHGAAEQQCRVLCDWWCPVTRSRLNGTLSTSTSPLYSPSYIILIVTSTNTSITSNTSNTSISISTISKCPLPYFCPPSPLLYFFPASLSFELGRHTRH